MCKKTRAACIQASIATQNTRKSNRTVYFIAITIVVLLSDCLFTNISIIITFSFVFSKFLPDLQQLSQMHGCTDPGNYYLSPGSCIAPLLSRTSPMQFLRPPQWQVPRPVAHGIPSGQEEWPRDDRSLRGRILEHETTGTRHYVR